MAYYNRPMMVRRALQSVKESTHKDWELAIIDDGSDEPIAPIVDEMFTAEEKLRTTIENSGDGKSQKILQGGSRHGLYLNEFIKKSDAELALFLCDDDALVSTYLERANEFFECHPDVNQAYSHIIPYNPLHQHYKDADQHATWWLNQNSGAINTGGTVDASQVVWRTKCNKEQNIWLPSPQNEGLDAALFNALSSKCGMAWFMNCKGQYKGIHAKQLGNTHNFDSKD